MIRSCCASGCLLKIKEGLKRRTIWKLVQKDRASAVWRGRASFGCISDYWSVHWGRFFSLCWVDGNFSEAFALCSSPGCFLPISLQAERERWDTVFLPRSSLPPPAMTMTRTISMENGGWTKCIFSWVWGFILVLFPWLVSSVTTTALCIAGFTVVKSASCASSPRQEVMDGLTPAFPSLSVAGMAAGTAVAAAFPELLGWNCCQEWGFLWVCGVQTFLIMHPYLQKIFEHAPPMYVYIVIYKWYTCATEILIFLPATQWIVLHTSTLEIAAVGDESTKASQEADGTSLARSPLYQGTVRSSSSSQFFFWKACFLWHHRMRWEVFNFVGFFQNFCITQQALLQCCFWDEQKFAPIPGKRDESPARAAFLFLGCVLICSSPSPARDDAYLTWPAHSTWSMQGALSLMIKGLRRHKDLELIVTSICRETRKIFCFKKSWANLTFFPSLVEIFVTQARSTPPPKRNSQCSMQSPWGVDSWFFGGWWRGTFWNLVQFFWKGQV